MRIIIDHVKNSAPPHFVCFIHDAPHRRQHRAVIKKYREHLRKAFHGAGLKTPYAGMIDLSLYFINPTSPDYDNLLTALYQAMDGKALGGNGILKDDGQVYTIHKLAKFYAT